MRLLHLGIVEIWKTAPFCEIINHDETRVSRVIIVDSRTSHIYIYIYPRTVAELSTMKLQILLNFNRRSENNDNSYAMTMMSNWNIYIVDCIIYIQFAIDDI